MMPVVLNSVVADKRTEYWRKFSSLLNYEYEEEMRATVKRLETWNDTQLMREGLTLLHLRACESVCLFVAFRVRSAYRACRDTLTIVWC